MINQFLPWIKRVVKANKTVFPRGMRDVLLMCDGAPWHKKAFKGGLCEAMGLPKTAWVEHPSNSPDMRGPIEGSHGLLTRRLQKLLRELLNV